MSRRIFGSRGPAEEQLKRVDAARRRRADRQRRRREHRERARAIRRLAKRLGREADLRVRRSYARTHGLFFDPRIEREQIVLPAVFSLHDNHDETAAVLDLIRERTLRRNGTVMLHFSDVESIDAAATLALVAEIYRIRSLRSIQSVTGTYPRLRRIYDQLKSMGFYRILNIAERDDVPDPVIDPTKPVFLPFITGNKVSAEMVDRFVDVIEDHLFSMNEVARGRLVAAVIEAMTNTLDHAHPRDRRVLSETMTDRWWMSSWVNVIENEITVLLFDQGVGIPNTLDPTTYERIRAALRGVATLRSLSAKPGDGEMILAATEFHRTGTGQSGRGKGFRNMKQFVDVCADGELRVLSNRGRYRYVAGTEDCADESRSIGGTVIEWRFRHEGPMEMKDE